ncbi:MAG: hypothetical protein AAGJ46_01545 [Planctomycetota bacterium]
MKDTYEQLKVFVERIVRPVAASEKDKLKMREELYSHALDAFEHEGLGGSDPAVALRRTLARLGKPGETRAALQASVGWESRIEHANNRVFRRSAGVPLVRHAAKVGLLTGGALLLVEALIALPPHLAEVLRWNGEGQIHIRMCLMLGLLFGTGMFFGIMYSDVAWRIFERRFGRPGDRLRLLGLWALASGTYAALGWGFTLAVSHDPIASKTLGIYWFFGSGLALLFAPLLIEMDLRERRPLAEWHALDLGDSTGERAVAE